MYIDIEKVLAFLKENPIVSQITDISIDKTIERGVYKIICHLIPSKYKLQIKLIITPEYLIYSYQLFTHNPLLRWDNAPHFPNISTYPHHFHNEKGKIVNSKLTGDIESDLSIVFIKIQNYIQSNF